MRRHVPLHLAIAGHGWQFAYDWVQAFVGFGLGGFRGTFIRVVVRRLRDPGIYRRRGLLALCVQRAYWRLGLLALAWSVSSQSSQVSGSYGARRCGWALTVTAGGAACL